MRDSMGADADADAIACNLSILAYSRLAVCQAVILVRLALVIFRNALLF